MNYTIGNKKFVLPSRVSEVCEYIGREEIWAVGAEQGLINIYTNGKLSEDMTAMLMAAAWPVGCQIIISKKPPAPVFF